MPHSPPIKIALVACDTLIPPIVSVYGNHHSIFSALLTRSLPLRYKGLGPKIFTLDMYDIFAKGELPPPGAEGYDAVLISGSASSAYEDLDWINRLVAYVKDIAANKPQVKLFGVCFGHQIIGRALGGVCEVNKDTNGKKKWEVGPTQVELSEIGKKVFGKGKGVLNVQQFHGDHVPLVHFPTTQYPFQIIGTTHLCTNQGMVLFDDHPATELSNKDSIEKDSPSSLNPSLLHSIRILTIQGHPEYHAGILRPLIEARRKNGVLSAEIADDARDRNELEVQVLGVSDKEDGAEEKAEKGDGWVNDGRAIGEVIWGVLGLY